MKGKFKRNETYQKFIHWLVAQVGSLAIVPQTHPVSLKLLRFTAFITVLSLMMLLPLPLTPHTGKMLSVSLLLCMVIIATGLLTLIRVLLKKILERGRVRLDVLGVHVKSELPLLNKQLDMLTWSVRLLYKAGIALPALVFVSFWALVYLLIWSFSPHSCEANTVAACQGAFQGLSAHPSFGDFIYLSVNLAFGHYLADILPHSELAKTVTTVEVISDIGLVTLYTSTFLGLRSVLTSHSRGADSSLDVREEEPLKA